MDYVLNYLSCGYRQAWIMWDLDNGHAYDKKDIGKGYIWVFSTKKEALEHRKKQHSNPDFARLSMPKKITRPRK